LKSFQNGIRGISVRDTQRYSDPGNRNTRTQGTAVFIPFFCQLRRDTISNQSASSHHKRNVFGRYGFSVDRSVWLIIAGAMDHCDMWSGVVIHDSRWRHINSYRWPAVMYRWPAVTSGGSRSRITWTWSSLETSSRSPAGTTRKGRPGTQCPEHDQRQKCHFPSTFHPLKRMPQIM